MRVWMGVVVVGCLTTNGGAQTTVADAVKAGFTVIDLSDDWTPYIFQEPLDDSGAVMENRYREVLLGLANDRGDRDGQPLPENEHNYLELYGIPPTLSVLRARFIKDAETPDRCEKVDFAKIRDARSIPMHATKNEDVQVPAAHEDAFAEVEKRLICEGLLSAKKHTAGRFDPVMRQSLIQFQQKHKLYDAASLRPDTIAALGHTLLENDYAALLRTLTERVTAAANILEDGSTDTAKGPRTYVNAAGEHVPVRNLVDEALSATITQLGLQTPAAALAFFQKHPATDFASLRVGVKLPAPPEYYSPAMDLSVEIDRGDVIYDPPFDQNGKATNQTRHRFPSFTLRVKYRGQIIPLVHWRTTIGGWRSDLAANGYEYYRYKGSDVGARVWRNIVAGPVWIAPNSTPVRTLVKEKFVHGSSQKVVNYDEVGPGYLSAYGLVAAYNVVPGKTPKQDWDNGVRVHGSSEILSIRNPDAYSHGCHRLMNHLAVRLFSFVLQHRAKVIEGDKSLNFSREFLWKDDVYEMRLPSRGFWYRLEPPLPVVVTEGNILGKTRKPITVYVPKPGVVYPPGPPPIPPDSPESRAGGGE